MFTVNNYVVAESLDHAYELLNGKKNNFILGGLLWLKMGRNNINTAIDLSKLNLNTIEEKEDTIEIGCMATLRDIETSPILNQYFDGVLPKSVKNIVGVQFRNCATVGGSIFSRFGFSDILTALLALDSYVLMHNGGLIPLADFVNMPYEKDILVKVIINKDGAKASYQDHRMQATDFPVLVVAASKSEAGFKIAVGARPSRAKLAVEAQSLLSANPTEAEIELACEKVVNELTFGTNLRGSAEYRKVLAKVLVKRAILEIN